MDNQPLRIESSQSKLQCTMQRDDIPTASFLAVFDDTLHEFTERLNDVMAIPMAALDFCNRGPRRGRGNGWRGQSIFVKSENGDKRPVLELHELFNQQPQVNTQMETDSRC